MQSPSQCFGFSFGDAQRWLVGITISRGSFVFSQSRVKVCASLTNEGILAVRKFDLVNCSLSFIGFVHVFNVGQ